MSTNMGMNPLSLSHLSIPVYQTSPNLTTTFLTSIIVDKVLPNRFPWLPTFYIQNNKIDFYNNNQSTFVLTFYLEPHMYTILGLQENSWK